MNQRIQKLYAQALENKFDYGGGRGVKPGEYYSNYKTVLNAEKFALLIIQECANLFEVEWGEEKLTGNDVGYVVKKHFGVQW